MSADFQIGYIILVVTFMLVALVFFVVFSIVQYQKAKGYHIDEMIALKSNFQKEMLSTQIETQKETLDNVSSELHDNIGQVLSLAKMNLYQANKKHPNENVSQSIEYIGSAVEGLRNVAHLISSNDITNNSLMDLLKKEVLQVNESGAMIGELRVDDEKQLNIGPEKTFMLYRIIQECINNTIKHGRAQKINIIVSNNKDEVELCIIDDGIGFVVNNTTLKSNGLQNLQKRANVMGATLKIASEINIGTSISVKLKRENQND